MLTVTDPDLDKNICYWSFLHGLVGAEGLHQTQKYYFNLRGRGSSDKLQQNFSRPYQLILRVYPKSKEHSEKKITFSCHRYGKSKKVFFTLKKKKKNIYIYIYFEGILYTRNGIGY